MTHPTLRLSSSLQEAKVYVSPKKRLSHLDNSISTITEPGIEKLNSEVTAKPTRLIIGEEILTRGLLTDVSKECLKHATYDLTIGEIFPVGKDGYEERRAAPVMRYAIQPREAVWILSREEFNLPCDVTGLATLRTTFTKQGLVAFNVGIIDPFYKGPISTVLLNFSKRSVDLELGEKFFRVLLFEHSDVSDYHHADESVERSKYQNDLTGFALNDYSKNFLDIPELTPDHYASTARKMFWGIVGQNKIWALIVAVLLLGPIVYTWLSADYLAWFDPISKAIKGFVAKIRP